MQPDIVVAPARGWWRSKYWVVSCLYSINPACLYSSVGCLEDERRTQYAAIRTNTSHNGDPLTWAILKRLAYPLFIPTCLREDTLCSANPSKLKPLFVYIKYTGGREVVLLHLFNQKLEIQAVLGSWIGVATKFAHPLAVARDEMVRMTVEEPGNPGFRNRFSSQIWSKALYYLP